MAKRCVMVWTTVATEADARSLAQALVGEGLAACVNVSAEMESTYRWKGRIEVERERQLVIKTTSERVPALEARLRALHPYELPELIVLPIEGGSEAYLDWIRASTLQAG